jgi:hypothetical protein
MLIPKFPAKLNRRECVNIYRPCGQPVWAETTGKQPVELEPVFRTLPSEARTKSAFLLGISHARLNRFDTDGDKKTKSSRQ